MRQIRRTGPMRPLNCVSRRLKCPGIAARRLPCQEPHRARRGRRKLWVQDLTRDFLQGGQVRVEDHPYACAPAGHPRFRRCSPKYRRCPLRLVARGRTRSLGCLRHFPFDKCIEIERPRRTALLAIDQRLAKCFQFSFALLEQTKTRPHHIARRGITAVLNAAAYESVEMIAKRERCVLRQFAVPFAAKNSMSKKVYQYLVLQSIYR